MPRMSIDSKFGRDPRVLRLAKACGWSRRETMGALLDVWEVCYERVSEVLSIADIDAAAELDGFAQKLIECELGRATKRGVRVSGAKERIAYLKRSRDAGRKGGLKSGESRRNSSKRPFKGRFSDPSHETNPPDLVPDTAPDLAPDPDPAPGGAEESAIVRVPILTPPPRLDTRSIPENWEPADTNANRTAAAKAEGRGVVIGYALDKFRAQMRSAAKRSADWDAEWRAYLATEFPTPAAIREGLTRVEREAAARAERERHAAEERKRQEQVLLERHAVQAMLAEWRAGSPQTPEDVALVHELQSREIARAVIDGVQTCPCGAPASHGLYEHLCGSCGDQEVAAKRASILALVAGRAPPENAERGEGERRVQVSHPRQPAKEATE